MIRSRGLSKTRWSATVSSTTPRLTPRCPPVRETASTRNSRISPHSRSMSAYPRPRRSSGPAISGRSTGRFYRVASPQPPVLTGRSRAHRRGPPPLAVQRPHRPGHEHDRAKPGGAVLLEAGAAGLRVADRGEAGELRLGPGRRAPAGGRGEQLALAGQRVDRGDGAPHRLDLAGGVLLVGAGDEHVAGDVDLLGVPAGALGALADQGDRPGDVLRAAAVVQESGVGEGAREPQGL